MSYAKAAELLDLALEIAAKHFGMTYAEIDGRSTAPSQAGRRRNTQRLVRALEGLFGARLTTQTNEFGEKVVFLQSDALRSLVDLEASDLSALDHAVSALDNINAVADAEALRKLGTKLRLVGPARKMAGVEVDYEALLNASHLAVRHGPRPMVASSVMQPLTQALLGLRQCSFDYHGAATVQRRVVHPYGIIFGPRPYLVALIEGASGRNPSRWRIDRIKNVEILEARSARPEQFDLEDFAKRSFGGFGNDREYGEVEWRFSSQVADNVRGYRFHSDQELIEAEDGSITVRFSASGHLEMAWALYPWGDNVEVIKPAELQAMIEGYRRADFDALP